MPFDIIGNGCGNKNPSCHLCQSASGCCCKSRRFVDKHSICRTASNHQGSHQSEWQFTAKLFCSSDSYLFRCSCHSIWPHWPRRNVRSDWRQESRASKSKLKTIWKVRLIRRNTWNSSRNKSIGFVLRLRGLTPIVKPIKNTRKKETNSPGNKVMFR